MQPKKHKPMPFAASFMLVLSFVLIMVGILGLSMSAMVGLVNALDGSPVLAVFLTLAIMFGVIALVNYAIEDVNSRLEKET